MLYVLYMQELAYHYDLTAYVEVNSITNDNIDEAFILLARNIVAKFEGCTAAELYDFDSESAQVTVRREKLNQHQAKQLDDNYSLTNTYQQPASHVQLDHTVCSEVLPMCRESSTENEQVTHAQLEEQKRKALEVAAQEEVLVYKAQVNEYQRQIEEKDEKVDRINERNQKLQGRMKILEEELQTAMQQLHDKDCLVAKHVHESQEVQRRLKQSEEAVEAARQQVREREQQASRYADSIRTLENRVQELEEEATESQQRITELEQQLRQAELRLTNSDQVFQDIFQRLVGQLPQSQPHWVVQRNEIQLTGEELGTGGWASVNVALFRGQRVAAKCLHQQIISAHNIRLFTREMSIAAQARHPNLLQFIGATMDNNPIILTELMPTSLRRILEQGVQLQRRQIVSIASDVARALNYLHLNTPDPIIHRDISSANVLLEQFGDVYKAKVSDYGSANFSRYTSTAGPGNPLYSAPEAGDPSRQSVKMDVYSFGLLLVEMCSGELFDDHEELIRTRINDWPEVVGVIRPCIRRDPKRRPNMDAVLTQLTQLQN